MEHIVSKHFDGVVYDSGPVKFTDIVSNKNELVHQAAYNDALEKLLDDLAAYDYTEYTNKYENSFVGIVTTESGSTYESNDIADFFTKENIMTAVEIPSSEYWIAPYVMIIYKILNYKNREHPRYLFIRKNYNLYYYWNVAYDKYDKKTDHIKVTKEHVPDIKISHFDYYRGKATLSSRQEDIKYDVDFDLLSSEDEVSDEAKLPKDLFITQLRNM